MKPTNTGKVTARHAYEYGAPDPFTTLRTAEWMGRGLCAQTGPDDHIWFPDKGGSAAKAREICSGCEVRAQCLAYALETEQRFGIFGGMTERDRMVLRRGRAS